MAGVNAPYRYQYETVAAGQAAQVLGGTGAIGDYIHRVIVTAANNTASNVTLIDGSTSIALTVATTPVGTYSIEINAASLTGAWKITTGAGATVIAVGIFSA